MAYAVRNSSYRRKTVPKRKTTTYRRPVYKPKRPIYKRRPTLYRKMKQLTQSVESKICGVRDLGRDCVDTHNGSKTHMVCISTHHNNYGDFVGLNAFNFPQGDDRNSRNGSKMFLKHLFIKMEIVAKHMDHGTLSSSDIDRASALSDLKFRVVFFKFRPRRAGEAYNPANDFFVAEDGSNKGISTSNMIGSDQMLYMINTKRYDVLHQQQFSLSPPIQAFWNASTSNKTYSAMVQGKHPSERIINKKITFNKPLFFSNSGLSVPTGNNDVYIAIISTSADKQFAADNWNVSTYMTTTCNDN